MARTRDNQKQIRALELRSEGKTQREVASELDVSVRTVSRWESRWRRGDRPLSGILGVLWERYDNEQNEWRRVRLLQSLMKGAVAQAEANEAALARDLLLCAYREIRDRDSPLHWRTEVPDDLADTMTDVLISTRDSA